MGSEEVTLRRAAMILGIGYETARQWRLDGKIEAIKKGGRYMVSLREIERIKTGGKGYGADSLATQNAQTGRYRHEQRTYERGHLIVDTHLETDNGPGIIATTHDVKWARFICDHLNKAYARGEIPNVQSSSLCSS